MAKKRVYFVGRYDIDGEEVNFFTHKVFKKKADAVTYQEEKYREIQERHPGWKPGHIEDYITILPKMVDESRVEYLINKY